MDIKIPENQVDEAVQEKLDLLLPVQPLSPQAVAAERARFLAQAESLRSTVSKPPMPRHKEWISNIILTFRTKDKKTMLHTLMTIVLAVTFLFGGSGATVYAAQSSQPDQPLYGLKIWSEDAHLRLQTSAQERLALVLDFANRRLNEMTRLCNENKEIPTATAERLQYHLNTALQLAAGMEDAPLVQAMEQIRTQAENQLRLLAGLVDENPDPNSGTLLMLQERLRLQIHLAETGISDPAGVRQQIRDRDRLSQPTLDPTNPPAQATPTGNSYGPGPGAAGSPETPGQYGQGEPSPSQTPMPTGDSYGPGPAAGEPSATQGSYGPGPQAATATCTPAQDGSGAGQPSVTPQQNNNPGNGQPTPTTQGKKP